MHPCIEASHFGCHVARETVVKRAGHAQNWLHFFRDVRIECGVGVLVGVLQKIRDLRPVPPADLLNKFVQTLIEPIIASVWVHVIE